MLYWVFVVAVIVQCVYALYFFVRILWLPAAKELPAEQISGMSIIICAKNEAVQLRKNLAAVLGQQYEHSFEVIVVNDASTDDTDEALQAFAGKFDHLKVVNINSDAVRSFKGKKYALSVGMQAAQYEQLLLTDADCVPASDNWLALMAAPAVQGREIVAGYGGYNTAPGLLNAFVRWETLHTFLQYSTYALAGVPYMAVGRNMACTKSAMLRAMSSDVWNAVPSGDDDLLVRAVATRSNMAVVSDVRAFTYTDAKGTWSEWLGQKQRHMSTGKYYKPLPKALLGLYGISHGAMWVFFLGLVWGCGPVAVIMAGRCLLYWSLWAVAAYRLKEQRLIYLFPCFDIGWVIYNFALLPYITLKNKQQWT